MLLVLIAVKQQVCPVVVLINSTLTLPSPPSHPLTILSVTRPGGLLLDLSVACTAHEHSTCAGVVECGCCSCGLFRREVGA